jgi:hypothetical protein
MEYKELMKYTKALQIVADLILIEYNKCRYNEAFALVHALAKLASKVGQKPSDFIDVEIIKAIDEGPCRLQQQLADPASEVTPELFVAGIKQALLEPHTHNDRPSFEIMLMKMWDVQRKKGADYGSDEDPLANLKASEAWGLPGWQNALSRLDDKRFRLISFILKQRLVNESAYDAFRDFAVYSVRMWRLFCEWLAQQRQSTKIRMEFDIPPKVLVLDGADESKLKCEDSDEVYSELDSEEGLPIG